MKTLILFFAALIPATLWAAQPATEVRVRQLGPNHYEFTMTTSQTTDVGVAQNALIPGARKLCGEKKPEFGRYKFEAKEPLNKAEGASPQTLVLRQEIRCVAAASLPIQEQQPVASAWQPTKAQEENIKKLTYQYFNKRDSGNYQEAYSLFAASLKAGISEKNWLASIKQFNAKAGRPVERQILKVTWYNKPPSSPTPGIFAAVDYKSQFQNIDIHCGYVIWQQQKDGSFQIVREEENAIDKATQSSMKERDIVRVKAQFGCVSGR